MPSESGLHADPPVGPRDHWFEDIADHLGRAYLRYSFTRGTANEVDFLVDALGLRPGMRVLDVGCGPGRHAHALGARGLTVVGVDISQRFVDVAADGAPDGVSFVRADARALGFDAEFDAAISLCQGAFGLIAGPAATAPMPDGSAPDGEPDLAVLRSMQRALRPGGRAAVSAFSAYFQLRYLEAGDDFDANAGVNHERTDIRDESGQVTQTDLWTTCFTPRELRLLFRAAGLRTDRVLSVTPGSYTSAPPSIDSPEFLVIGTRPGA